MESIYVVIMICVAAILCWALIWTFFDEIDDFITKLAFSLKLFNAKVVYKRNVRKAKRDCRHNDRKLKGLIRNERNQIKDKINNSIGYCYINIVYKENIDWLKKKGFKITETKYKAKYKISWGSKK